MKVTGKQFANNFIWKVLEQFGAQIITLILTILLARILDPKSFGVISLTSIFISFSDIFVQGGLNTAILQKEKVDKLDYSTVTFLSLVLAVVMYAIIFIISPIIAGYYDTPELELVLKVLAIIIFFNAINALLYAAVLKNMKVKLSFISNIISGIISGSIGIALALNGAGVWALVVQKLVQQFVITIILSFSLRWKFSIKYSSERAKTLFKFSFKVLAGSMIAFISDNSYNAIIGKSYSTEQLGYCDKGDQLPKSTILNIVMALVGVSLPTLSSYQSDLPKLKDMTRKIVRVSSFIIFPMAIGMIVTAQDVIILLFTEKWLKAVPILKLACVFYSTTPLLQICGQAIYAVGKSEIRFWSELFKMVLTLLLISLLVGVFKVDILVVVALKSMISFIMILWTSFFTKKFIQYGLIEQIRDLLPSLIMSLGMGVIVSLVGRLTLNIYISLLLQIGLGVLIYLLLSFITKTRAFSETLSVLRLYLKRNAQEQ